MVRVTVGRDVELVSSALLLPNQILIDSGSGRLWQISTAFSGRAIHVSASLESSGDVMHVMPTSQRSLHLVQYTAQETEPYEDQIERLMEEIQRLKNDQANSLPR